MLPKLITLLMLVLITLSCDNDLAPAEVPSVVENTFKSQFPNATEIEWESRSSGFEVDFEIDQIDYSAIIDDAGTLTDYKYEILRGSIPLPVLDALKIEDAENKWNDPEILVNGKDTYYQVEIDGFFNDKKIILDSSGKKIDHIKAWKL